MKKSSGVRLQELHFFSYLQYCHTDRPVSNFSKPFFLYFFLKLSLLSLSPLKHLSLSLLSIFSPDVSPFLIFFFSFSVSLLSHSLPSTPFSASFPRGSPVWYSTCVVGRQDGLEHGQAPQTTLIYRTAFQSLLQCCSTYINTSTGREPKHKRGKKWK